MTRTFLSILIALVFVFGAAGVIVAAARQSQPGEPFYTLRTWSTQILHQQEKTQIQAGQMGKMTQSRSGMHEQETFPTPQSTATHEPCNQSGTNAQCGFHQGVGEIHADDHPAQDNSRAVQKNYETDHRNDRSGHDNDDGEHGNDAGEHNDH